MIFTIIFLKIIKYLNIVFFEDFSVNTAKKVFLVSMLYTINVGVALTALAGLKVPVYGALKRMSMLSTLFGEYIILNKVAPVKITSSILIIIAGILIMATGDMEFNLQAYMAAAFSCLAQSSFLLILKKKSLEKNLTTFGLLYYNSVLSLPILTVLFVVSGDMKAVLNYHNWSNIYFLLCLVLSLLLGFLLNFSTFLCTVVNSPLDVVVSGQCKVIGQTVLGFFVLGGMKTTLLHVIGLNMTVMGGLVYAWTSYKISQEIHQHQPISIL
eukprot:TRINITY_DN4753_c0_g1_i18.p1 TRINITY_DN4753_c0_g1~~TRINITY_DN4753_c0_g1_i18.p1  ORF type:complete len:269 (+),score=38.51 TRINITY_DN4753_c0_g1_i18:308-1114(+)